MRILLVVIGIIVLASLASEEVPKESQNSQDQKYEFPARCEEEDWKDTPDCSRGVW